MENNINMTMTDENMNNAGFEPANANPIDVVYGLTTATEATLMDGTDRDVQAIIDGDISNTFQVISSRGEFSARESYALTRPDDDDENTISIGKQARNAVIEIDRYLIYAFEVDGKMRVGICIFGCDGKKYVTTSIAFIKEFILLDRLYKQDGETMNTIKVIHKESKNKTHDGQKMYYPMPIGL